MGRHRQGCRTSLQRFVLVRPGLAPESHRLQVTDVGGDEEGRKAILKRFVLIRPSFAQESRHLQVTDVGGAEEGRGAILLVLSLFTITLTLGNGRTTVLGGAVHLVIFAAYLFVTVVP